MNAAQKLQAALTAFTGDTGPVEWSVEEREDGGASLVAYYEEGATCEGNPLEDEPWTKFGSDAILEAAGFDRCDGGMDSYQQFGKNMVCQWAIVKAAE